MTHKPDPVEQGVEYKVIRLKRNGPKPGQSSDAWLYGKQKGHEELMAKHKTRNNQNDS